jgi:hypothetical protein
MAAVFGILNSVTTSVNRADSVRPASSSRMPKAVTAGGEMNRLSGCHRNRDCLGVWLMTLH